VADAAAAAGDEDSLAGHCVSFYQSVAMYQAVVGVSWWPSRLIHLGPDAEENC
jgi:hypothetical protein